MEMKSNYLSNSHENYIRMLILFIPYLDYSFFFDDEIERGVESKNNPCITKIWGIQ